MKIHQVMKELLELIKSKRKQDSRTFGPLLNKIKHNKEWIRYIENKTQFLDNVYDTISIAQRFYHLWFGVDIKIYLKKI